jgi:hypothetical protein
MTAAVEGLRLVDGGGQGFDGTDEGGKGKELSDPAAGDAARPFGTFAVLRDDGEDDKSEAEVAAPFETVEVLETEEVEALIRAIDAMEANESANGTRGIAARPTQVFRYMPEASNAQAIPSPSVNHVRDQIEFGEEKVDTTDGSLDTPVSSVVGTDPKAGLKNHLDRHLQDKLDRAGKEDGEKNTKI